MHVAYLLTPGGGPDAFVGTILPWLEAHGHRVSIVYSVSADAHKRQHRFPSSVQVEFITPTTAHYYLAKVIRGFRAWPLRLRAWEEAKAAVGALKKIERTGPIDLVEITEGVSVAPIQKHWPVSIRAHGSDWTVRYFCRDPKSRNDGPLIKAEAKQLRKAIEVSAISNHLADHLSTFCRFPREAIGVLPYPVDTERFSPRLSTLVQRRTRSIMAIGRLEPWKGTDLLVKAMAQVWQHFPDTELHLLGSEAGLTMKQLREMAPPQYRHNIIHPGFVPRDNLPAYYNNVSIVVAPTLYETFGYTVLEAMACGRPVIAGKVGGIPEIVRNGETGILVPAGDIEALADSIISLLSDPARAEALGAAGRRRAMRYDLDVICPQLESSYQGKRLAT